MINDVIMREILGGGSRGNVQRSAPDQAALQH
jgi:hypothetical protein